MPPRYGGLIAFTGGLIGPPETDFHYPGSLAGTPVFLGSGDPDPHVPWQRVQESATVLATLGADVALQRYPGNAAHHRARGNRRGEDADREGAPL